MSVMERDLISASENERSALDQIQGVLKNKDHVARLVGPSGEEIPLPPSLFLVLRRIVKHMMLGRAISIIPVGQELTTQQAADILNVSRPYLVKLLEREKIPFTKVGSQRRIRSSDLFAYQKRREIERQQALDEIAQISQELGVYD